MVTGKQVLAEWLFDHIAPAGLLLAAFGYIIRLHVQMAKMEARISALEAAKEPGR